MRQHIAAGFYWLEASLPGLILGQQQPDLVFLRWWCVVHLLGFFLCQPHTDFEIARKFSKAPKTIWLILLE